MTCADNLYIECESNLQSRIYSQQKFLSKGQCGTLQQHYTQIIQSFKNFINLKLITLLKSFEINIILLNIDYFE